MYDSLRNRLLSGHNPNVEPIIPGGCPGAELYLRRMGRSRTNPGADGLYARRALIWRLTRTADFGPLASGFGRRRLKAAR